MFVPLYDHNPLEHIRRPFVNWAIIALTVAVHLVLQGGLLPEEVYIAAAWNLGLTPVLFLDGQPPPADLGLVPELLTPLTYALVHADVWHLAGNMVFLWVFGDNVEDALGHGRYLVFYVLTAVAGGLAHALMLPGSDGPLIGASGAVAGVVAAYLMLHPRTKLWILVLWRVPLRITARWPLALWVGLQLVSLLSPEDFGVAWWAHIGGLAAGAVLVVLLKRPEVALFDRDMPAAGT
jgi:membrane associated rhomboid family serine protease